MWPVLLFKRDHILSRQICYAQSSDRDNLWIALCKPQIWALCSHSMDCPNACQSNCRCVDMRADQPMACLRCLMLDKQTFLSLSEVGSLLSIKITCYSYVNAQWKPSFPRRRSRARCKKGGRQRKWSPFVQSHPSYGCTLCVPVCAYYITLLLIQISTVYNQRDPPFPGSVWEKRIKTHTFPSSVWEDWIKICTFAHFLGCNPGLCSQSEYCRAKCKSDVCAGQSLYCLDPYFAHNRYTRISIKEAEKPNQVLLLVLTTSAM